MTGIVLVFGLSGVGKSWMCSRLANKRGYLHVSASALIRAAKVAAAGGTVTSDELRTGAVLDNQRLLVSEFRQVRGRATATVLFDGHNIVDGDGELVRIPLDVVRDLGPTGIVFVHADVGTIRDRRDRDLTRRRPIRSAETLGEQQREALELAREHATILSIDFEPIEAGDETAFAAAVERLAVRSSQVQLPVTR